MGSLVAHVLGWDPGPSTSAWALLDKVAFRHALAKPFHFVAGGSMPSTREALWRILAVDGPKPIVGVESPEGYIFEHARGAQLLKTKGVASEIATMARDLGLAVVEKPAQVIRQALCGRAARGAHGDAAVVAAVARLVSGMPRRSSNHLRDAVLCAVFAGFNPGAAT